VTNGSGFGAVADLYDEVRPGYPAVLGERLLDFHGGRPRAVVEQWTPPAGGVDMIACACGWHWLDAASRARLAHAALAPGGTLAIFRHRYALADPAAELAIGTAVGAAAPIEPDYSELALFSRVLVEAGISHHDYTRERYLRLMQTFAPFRRHSPDRQSAVLESVGAAIDGLGGTVVLELRTTLVLARA